MTTYVVKVSGNDTSGTGSEANPWRSIAKLNTALKLGDIGLIYPGAYSSKIQPANSGVTYRAYTPGTVTLSVAADFSDRSHVTLDGLNFTSTSGMYIKTNGLSHFIWLLNCGFSSTWAGTDFAWAGVDLNGDWCRIHNCTFGPWMGGDMIQVFGDHVWIKDNDLGYADAGHSPINVHGSYYVVEGNYVRNKWGRAGVFAPEASDTTPTPLYGVVQHNTFFDNNVTGDGLTNEGYPVQGNAV